MTADDYFTSPPVDNEYNAEAEAEKYEDHCNDCYDRLQDYLITKQISEQILVVIRSRSSLRTAFFKGVAKNEDFL